MCVCIGSKSDKANVLSGRAYFHSVYLANAWANYICNKEPYTSIVITKHVCHYKRKRLTNAEYIIIQIAFLQLSSDSYPHPLSVAGA